MEVLSVNNAAGSFFEAIYFLFSWLPAPLDFLAFGALSLVLVVTIVRLVLILWDLLPFT